MLRYFVQKRVQHFHEIERGAKKRCIISCLVNYEYNNYLKSRINHGSEVLGSGVQGFLEVGMRKSGGGKKEGGKA